MSFTSRFVELPIKEFDKKKDELGLEKEFIDNVIYINPFEISSYKPTKDEDCDNIDCVSVKLKNGESFYVYYTLNQFENILNKCHTA